MMFDDPQNRLSVARTHQRELLQQEHMDRLARQADPDAQPTIGPLAGARSWLALLFARGRRLLLGVPASRARL
jgi:hypothetical protein